MPGEVRTSPTRVPDSCAVRSIDLCHLGHERVTGAWLAGDILFDPGPSSCLQTLLAALGDVRPRIIALTHIHLDHAGASGSLLELFPDAEVWVHERGAPHMVDPSRLLASASRLYGDQMQTLWGDFLAVAPARLRVLRGGERIAGLQVAYTPGHASHHVCYFQESSGWAFTGDVMGVRVSADGPVLAPTPPPDIDLQAWRRSIAIVADWQPSTIALTHFGAYHDVERHITSLLSCLQDYEQAAGLGEAEFIAMLRERIDPGLQGIEDPRDRHAYERAMPSQQTYLGLRRYLQRAGVSER